MASDQAPLAVLSLSNRNALVCGGSQGIGKAAAVALAALGANVTVLARNRDTLAAIVAHLPRPLDSARHGQIEVDVADHALLLARVEAAAENGGFQILVNNTAGPPPGTIMDADSAQFIDTFNRHLVTNHLLVQALLPGMREHGFGRIVNVISTSVKEPIANLGVSNTVRAAVAAWAKTLAAEVAGAGVTVNNVLPGFTATQRLEQIIAERMRASGKTHEQIVAGMLASVPTGRFAKPEEVAAAIAFLCSPAAAYITGINLPVDGGRTHSL